MHFLPEAGLVHIANEKWDLNQLVHVHSVSMVIVSLGIWDRDLGHYNT